MHIDLNLLLVLSLLLQTRSVTGTARRLGISQPAVSRSLAQLRDVFQDPLLIRTNRGMELTRRGEDLIPNVQEWMARTNSLFATQDFDPQLLDRRFRIASTDFGVTSVIGPALARFHRLAPKAKLEIVPFGETMHARLVTGDIDLIVTGLEPDLRATYGKLLFQERFSCLMRAGHPALAHQDALTMDEFLRWPHISVLIGETGFDRINALLGPRAAERNIIASLPYMQAAPFMLTQSDAMVVLPERIAHSIAISHKLGVATPPAGIANFDYWVLWHERNRRDTATIWLVDLLSASCQPPDE
ncbi:MAG: LysR family transcriptional regulator [Sphingobium sp.]